MSHTVRIDLAYDGGGFHGWQVQPELRTVQGELTDMVERLLQRRLKPTGAGRTDTGVHALGQVAHLPLLDATEAERLVRALPRLAPDDIEILHVREVAPSFDARFSAIWRRYEYSVAFDRDLFRRGYQWQILEAWDRVAVEEASNLVLGRHDFSSFCKTASLKEDNVCTVDECRWEWRPESAVCRVRADRFLHHMVRILVGTLYEIGCGRREPESMKEILAACDRCAAGTMAPAQGLYLAEVGYPEVLLDPGYTPAAAAAAQAANRPEETS